MRSKGEGSIFRQKRKRRDGTVYSRWCAEISLPDGRIKRHYADSKKELVQWKKEYNVEQSYLENKDDTFADFFEYWIGMKIPILKESSVIHYKSLYNNYIKPTFATKQLKCIDTTMVNAWVGTMLSQKSARTVSLVKALFTTVMSLAAKESRIVQNPCVDTVTIKVPTNTQVCVLTEKQIKEVLTHLKENPQKYLHGQLYYMVLLALATGMREGEICALQWEDIKGNKVHICHSVMMSAHGNVLSTTKTTTSNRIISVDADVLNALQCLHDGNSFVFHSRTGSKYGTAAIRMSWRHLVKRLGLSLSFHGLRHTHATQLLSHNIDVNEVAKRLGHSSLDITRVYAHFLPSKDEEAARVIGSIVKV